MENVASSASYFQQGGIWMWFILAAQIVSIAIILERIYALYILRRPSLSKLANQFEGDIKSGEIERVVQRAESLGAQHPLGVAIRAGARAALNMGGRDEIQSKMDEVLLEENGRVEKRTGFLSMLGNVGTLLGLLGTIAGLISAFAAAANYDPQQKALFLTQGISLAMITTAYGLIMAIPALVMYAVLQNRANRLNEDLNQGALKVFNWLSYNFETVPNKSLRRKRG